MNSIDRLRTTPLSELEAIYGWQESLSKESLCALLCNPDTEIAPWLVDGGADLNQLDQDGNPIWLNIITRNSNAAAVFDRLIHHYDTTTSVKRSPRINVHIMTQNGYPVLCYAVDRNLPDLCTALVKAGAPIDMLGTSGTTSICMAAFCGFAEIVSCLVALGANPNGVNGKVPICEWAGGLDETGDTLDALLQAGANINERDAEGLTAIYRAIGSGSHRQLTALITHDAYIDWMSLESDYKLWRNFFEFSFRPEILSMLAIMHLAGASINLPQEMIDRSYVSQVFFDEFARGSLRTFVDDTEDSDLQVCRDRLQFEVKCVVGTLTPRITEICAALQHLYLPTLVLVEILQAYYLSRWPRLRLCDLWNRAACVRHFHEKKSRQQQ